MKREQRQHRRRHAPWAPCCSIGSEAAKDYYDKYLLTPEQAEAHREGDIHIHDFDFYALTTTCCQIDLLKLFKGGFSTGHGFLREPQRHPESTPRWHASPSSPTRTTSTAARASRTLTTAWPPGVAQDISQSSIPTISGRESWSCWLPRREHDAARRRKDTLPPLRLNRACGPSSSTDMDYLRGRGPEARSCRSCGGDSAKSGPGIRAETSTDKETDRATYQAMEALIHNLNTMHSRAGAQTPFSSHQLRHRHLPRGPHGHPQHPAGHGRGPGPRRNAHLPHSDLHA